MAYLPWMTILLNKLYFSRMIVLLHMMQLKYMYNESEMYWVIIEVWLEV